MSVGGLSSFLTFAETLQPQNKGHDSQEDDQLRMMREVSEAQERLHRQQMEMEKVTGLVKFSDLILASPCRSTCARFSALSRFLSLIHQHRETLLDHLTHSHARDQGTAIVLPKRLQSALIEIL